jgi:hypothetical protein
MKASNFLYEGKSLKYEEIIQYDHTNDAILLASAISHDQCIVCDKYGKLEIPNRELVGDDGLCNSCRKDLTKKGKLISSIFLRYPPYLKSEKKTKNPWEILIGGQIIK